MKFLVQLMATLISALLLQLFFPWWIIGITAFSCGYLFKSTQNFLAGFLAIAILWGGYAVILDSAGAAPLAERVAGIFTISKPLLFLATSLVGGLIGGFACLSGSLFKTTKRKSLYY